MLKSNFSRTYTRRVLCLLLAVLLSGFLSGCSWLQGILPAQQERGCPFSEMTYTRPDADALIKSVQNVTNKIKKNDISYAKQLSELIDLNEDYWNYYAMYSLAYVKYAINTNDQFYGDEYYYCGESEPKINQALENLYAACSKSKHKSRFETDYFGEGFLDEYKNGGTLSNELVQLFQQEAQLIQTYNNETANPTLTYMGQTRHLRDLLQDALTVSERENIKKAYYQQANAKLGGIYSDLVKTRQQIAKKLGYASYADYAYNINGRDYTAQMGAEFVAHVERTLTPLYKALASKGQGQHPSLSAMPWKEIAPTVESSVTKINDSVKEAFSFMEKNGLYDIAPSIGKVQYNFTTYIPVYESPFIVINAYENQSDLLTFAHEFGHFTDMFLNYNRNNILDLSECASQGMEYLMITYLPESQKKLQNKLIEYKMFDTLYVHVTQSAYTAFEQEVYALSPEEVTLERINAIATDIGQRFGINADSISFGIGWVMIPHFFEESFYCISYCVSNDVALQIYQAECKKAGSGVDIYMNLLDYWSREEDATFLEIVEKAKLLNPCKKERVNEIAAFLQDYYDTGLPMVA